MYYLIYGYLIFAIFFNLHAMDSKNTSQDPQDIVITGLKLLRNFDQQRHYSKRVLLSSSDSDKEMKELSLLVQENDFDTSSIVSAPSWLSKNKQHIFYGGTTAARFIWYSSMVRLLVTKLWKNLNMTISPTNIGLSVLALLLLGAYPFLTETVITEIVHTDTKYKCNATITKIYLIAMLIGVGIGSVIFCLANK